MNNKIASSSFVWALVLLFTITSCKSKKTLTNVNDNDPSYRSETETRILDSIYEADLVYSSFETVADVDFGVDNDVKNVKAQVKIQKDEFIFTSINVMGIPFARAYITPTRVQFYERVNKMYLDEDISYLKKTIGIEFTFDQLQRLLLGEPILQPNRDNYTIQEINQIINLISVAKKEGGEIKGVDDLNQNLSFMRSNLTFFQQFFSTEDLSKKLQIKYDERDTEQRNVPSVITYRFEDKKNINIAIQYKRIKFDEDVRMRFNIPDGYTKIIVK